MKASGLIQLELVLSNMTCFGTQGSKEGGGILEFVLYTHANPFQFSFIMWEVTQNISYC